MSAVYYDNIGGFSQLKMENNRLYGRLNSGEWTEIETGGEQGEPGADGQSAYVYIAWCSDPSTGAGFSLTTPADYIAFLSTNTQLTSPQFSQFSHWAKYIGEDGTDGTDGLSTYVYYAYASDASGTNFALSPADGLNYQAILVTHTELVSPSLADFAGLFYQYKAIFTVGHNIFDIFYSMSSTTPPGAMDLSLGTLIASCNTVFPDFWEACVVRKADGSIRTLTEDEWQAEVTENGSCGAFVVDETAMSVRLPKITHMIQPGDIGEFTEAGLPNIYGEALIQAPIYGVTGAFVYGGTNSRLGGTTIDGGGLFRIDASAYNAIYGNSTTVQPPAVGAKLYIQVYTSAVPASVAQAAEFINMLESYLPLSGGTMTGTIATTDTENTITSNAERIIMSGGSTYLKGGNLRLYGDGYDGTMAGGFALVTFADETQGPALQGRPDGVFVWDGSDVSCIDSQNLTRTAGYIRYTNGFQMCWGIAESMESGKNHAVNFPVAFNESPKVFLGRGSAATTSSNGYWWVRGAATTNFMLYTTTTASFYWFAIGRWK